MRKQWHVRFKYEGVWYRSEQAFGERKAKSAGNAVARGDGMLSSVQVVVPQGFRTRFTNRLPLRVPRAAKEER